MFIDVRNDSDWEAGWIPGAVHLDSEKVFSKSMLVIYCNGANCPRSSQAVAQAVAWGFARVYYYRLGFPDWQAAGHPLE